ncbi:MAG TPA: transcriptional regulator NrdR [Thermoleophilaceae bacterium]|nr:transcriptional regulator NrdR [Thermoleophilaceae bacterium]
MLCPFCSFESTRVVDSRLAEPGDAVRRRRECAGCGNRFTTYERAEGPVVGVLKRDGSQERFDRQKLLQGLARAAGKRPVSEAQLEELADSIASAARRAGSVVRAEQIGDLAERGLARLDPVAAIQFASVYRDLADLDELEAVVRRFKDEPLAGADQLALEPAAEGAPVPSDPGSSIARPLEADGRTPETRRRHVRQP